MNRRMQLLRNKLAELSKRVKPKMGYVVYYMENGKAYTIPERKFLGEGDKWKQEKLETENIEGFLEVKYMEAR